MRLLVTILIVDIFSPKTHLNFNLFVFCLSRSLFDLIKSNRCLVESSFRAILTTIHKTN